VARLFDGPSAEAVEIRPVRAVRDEALKEMVLPPIGRLVVCYLHTPHGFGTSKLAEKFDKGIGVVNTARNWNTVLKMHELA